MVTIDGPGGPSILRQTVRGVGGGPLVSTTVRKGASSRLKEALLQSVVYI